LHTKNPTLLSVVKSHTLQVGEPENSDWKKEKNYRNGDVGFQGISYVDSYSYLILYCLSFSSNLSRHVMLSQCFCAL